MTTTLRSGPMPAAAGEIETVVTGQPDHTDLNDQEDESLQDGKLPKDEWPFPMCCNVFAYCAVDLPLCCYASCCPLCLYAEMMSKIDVVEAEDTQGAGRCWCIEDGHHCWHYLCWALCLGGCISVPIQCALNLGCCCLVSQFCNVVPWVTCTPRMKLSKKHGYRLTVKECCCPCCAHYCCGPCALYQEAAFVKRHPDYNDFECCCYVCCFMSWCATPLWLQTYFQPVLRERHSHLQADTARALADRGRGVEEKHDDSDTSPSEV